MVVDILTHCAEQLTTKCGNLTVYCVVQTQSLLDILDDFLKILFLI